MDDGTNILNTDALMEILHRLHPNDRRRVRLICRHWRHLIDTRTVTSLRSHAKVLVVTVESARVIDVSTGRRGIEWRLSNGSYSAHTTVVGTHNGIVCLRARRGNAISLYNPVTRERLAIPPLPPLHPGGIRDWDRTFSFAYDQATGRYRVVHIACYFNRVLVFTLGEAAWRAVVFPGAAHGMRYNLDAGIVTVNNTMYWAVHGKGGNNVMSFDLDGEQAVSAIALPSSTSPDTLRLTEVFGRFGITFSHVSQTINKIEVWVLDGGLSTERRPRVNWTHWYSLQVHAPRHQPKWHERQHLTLPHFSYDGEHILTRECLRGECALYKHRPLDDTKSQCGTVRISERNPGKEVARIRTCEDTFKTFAFVDTSEPLGVYRCW